MAQELLDCFVHNGFGLSRRQFISTFILASASSTLLGKPWRSQVLAQVQSSGSGDPDLATLTVKLSDFAPLQSDFGSVRLGTSAISNDLPQGLFYPVTINRSPGPIFHALDTSCTHEGCVVGLYNRFMRHMECPCHGSLYTIEGKVISGEARAALRTYATRFDGVNQLSIDIPGMGFSVLAFDADTVGQPRLRLEFLAFEHIEYEVRFRATMNESWGVIPFARTPEGAAIDTVLTGNSDYMSVYVDKPADSGFYAVVMRVKAV